MKKSHSNLVPLPHPSDPPINAALGKSYGLNQAEYEFAQHELIAKRGGVTDGDIANLKEGPKAKGWSEHEAALMQLADDLFENSVASDETWATLSKTYSTEQLMDAVFTVGQYNLVSWALNSFGVPLDDFLPGAQKK